MSASFYDSSAISKQDHLEIGTDGVDGFMSEPDSQHDMSRLTIIEIHSVFARKVRMRDITEIDFVRLLRLLRADIFRSLLGVVCILDEHSGDLHRDHDVGGGRYLDAVGAEVPGRHGHPAVVHVPGEHARRDLLLPALGAFFWP
jgi:hypothetical protein